MTWYTWLEQGRPINVSGQVLDAVARTLRLDMAEHRHLYQLAEATPLRSWDQAIGVSVPVPAPVLVLMRSLNPLPAVLVNGRFDVITSNDTHQALFRSWHSGPCVHLNLLWCCVTEPLARRLIVDYDIEIAHMVARMRAEYAAHVGDPEWEEDIRRLLDINEEFARLWARHEVAEPAVIGRMLDIPPHGRLSFSVSELNVAASPGLRIQNRTIIEREDLARSVVRVKSRDPVRAADAASRASACVGIATAVVLGSTCGCFHSCACRCARWSRE